MRLLIVGAGATGGYFGGRLAQAGRNVTFLVRPARAGQLRADGLRIVSPHGDATVSPKLVATADLTTPFDAVLLAVKAYALEAALDDVAPAIGPETVIVPVLNGMKHMDALVERFGAGPVLGGVCRVATTIDGEGRIVQLANFQELSYGERDGTRSARVERLDAVMQGAGFDARLSTEIEREMWEKWVLLAAFGGITCLMRGNVGEIAAAPGGGAFVERFLDEVVSVVRKVGAAPSAGLLASATTMLSAKGSVLTSSMYRDLANGSPIEADQIIGDLLARGTAAGLSTPLLAAAYAHLSVYEARRRAG